ncbi:MAG: hypothetical protein EAZ99_05605 [Alphaproteobacteria bacterium]|nr:hypothetical protein [Alphaproteobacteria bacterium]TAD90528.1 MAG: hypothetical protein EAZ99_05605 [Alphaproteobacteria bacterium]
MTTDIASAPTPGVHPTARIAQAGDLFLLAPLVRALLAERRRALSESQLEAEILARIGDGEHGGYLLVERDGHGIGVAEIDADGVIGPSVTPDPAHASAVEEALASWRQHQSAETTAPVDGHASN